jgi:hypothetical protein
VFASKVPTPANSNTPEGRGRTRFGEEEGNGAAFFMLEEEESLFQHVRSEQSFS